MDSQETRLYYINLALFLSMKTNNYHKYIRVHVQCWLIDLTVYTDRVTCGIDMELQCYISGIYIFRMRRVSLLT